MILADGFHFAFCIGSVFLVFDDIKNRTIGFGTYVLTLICGIIYAYYLPFEKDFFMGWGLFLLTITGVRLYKKQPVIACSDILYMMMILYIIQSKWYIYFICVGLIALMWHVIEQKQKNQPFLAILLMAYILLIFITELKC